MNKLISFLSILAIPTVLFAATITNEPTGTGNWGDGANWIGGVEPSNGDSVYIIAAGGYAPTNIDILDLEINTLFITNSDNITMVFTGNDLKLWGIRGLARSTVPVATNVIQNNLTFMNASQGWALGNNNIIIFEGVIGATNPAYRAGGDTGALPSKYVLRNTNTFAGGIGSNLSRYEIYSDANFGLVPAAPVANYLDNNYGSWTFSSLPGTCNKIVVHQNRGYRTSNGCTVYLDNNTKVVYKGVISDIGNNGWTRSGPGYLMLLYSNVFGGNMSSTPTPGGFGSMTRAMSDFAFGTPTANRYIRSADGNAYDFNGFRVSKDLYWYNGSANGAFRNCNVDCCSTVTSARILFNYGGTYVNTFSGPGDMLLTGNIITNPGSGMQLGVVFKAGSGTLTYQGVTAITNATSVRGGKMVYDYTVNNGRKLAALLDMTNGLGVRAAIEFIGNDSEDTTEAVTDIDPADNVVPSNIRASYGAGSITIRTGVGRNFTLLARRIMRAGGYDGANPLDITLENNGGGVAQVLVSAQGDGVLGGFHTFNKSTWMKISGGAVAGLADGEYDTAFWGDVSGTNKNVDVTADTTVSSNAYAQTIRFNNPAATTLTINSGQRIYLPASANMCYGGILVTPAAGAVTIDGAGTIDPGLNDSAVIHHYGANTLTIGARLGAGTSSESICKVGPGELILTNDLNQFFNLEVFGGTVTLPALRNKNIGQPGGANNIVIGSGTLKYTGAGDTCNRVIALRGNAVIEAAGSGPIEFIAAGGSNRVTQVSANDGVDYPLTLTGAGVGSLNGVMQMLSGNLYKKGSGTWYIGGTLSNLDTYVKEGTLCVTGAIVGDVYVQANGKLSGTGALKRDAAVSGTVAPGTSIGTLDAAWLTFEPGGRYEWEVDGGSVAADTIAVAGTLELPEAANSVTVKVVQVGGPVAGAYPLVTYAMLTGNTNALVVDAAGTGYSQASFNITDSGITMGLVPEPALLVLAPLALLALRRRA